VLSEEEVNTKFMVFGLVATEKKLSKQFIFVFILNKRSSITIHVLHSIQTVFWLDNFSVWIQNSYS